MNSRGPPLHDLANPVGHGGVAGGFRQKVDDSAERVDDEDHRGVDDLVTLVAMGGRG